MSVPHKQEMSFSLTGLFTALYNLHNVVALSI